MDDEGTNDDSSEDELGGSGEDDHSVPTSPDFDSDQSGSKFPFQQGHMNSVDTCNLPGFSGALDGVLQSSAQLMSC